ncbi:hypothetical protein [Azorhizobium oxalatiphilum]|uniref:hypothetical protein n=1 Tax=Azorhizobium oxalatiphilum TaxID=980631 RepID=UPI00166441F5|nr:hypothetical protein [Azorhizobium oxalatiphilum]
MVLKPNGASALKKSPASRACHLRFKGSASWPGSIRIAALRHPACVRFGFPSRSRPLMACIYREASAKMEMVKPFDD